MKTSAELRDLLKRIDHKGYPAYKDIRGQYQFPGYVLGIDHVQGDPFASPSKVSIRVNGKQAAFPTGLFDHNHKRIALQDYLLRRFAEQVDVFQFQAKGSGKSGLMSVSRCGQEVLERSGCQIDPENGDIILRMEIGFPANGRTINAGELEKILFNFLPVCVKKGLYYASQKAEAVQQTMELAQDQQYIRQELKKRELAAFVADGSILPRISGVSQKSMREAVRFCTPESMKVTMELPNHGILTGMGIPKGITLIVGGGYHGKSTLLKALELGVYNHIAGDGREYVITEDTAVKIRAEDGRSIRDVDISMFIRDLPNKKDTRRFTTEDASGSTSQAANVVEGMEAGAGLFLIDEDTSATNFMIRDELMQRVVHREAEPIIPFIDRIKELYEKYGISTILVAGSSGSYFHKADYILQMEQYLPRDITELAKKEAESFPIPTEPAAESEAPAFTRKLSKKLSFKGERGGGRGGAHNDRGRGDGRVKMKTMGKDGFSINHETVDLRYVEQIADTEQVNALGNFLKYAVGRYSSGEKTMREMADELEALIRQKGFAAICDGEYLPGNLAMPRRQEIFACLNRWRGR